MLLGALLLGQQQLVLGPQMVTQPLQAHEAPAGQDLDQVQLLAPNLRPQASAGESALQCSLHDGLGRLKSVAQITSSAFATSNECPRQRKTGLHESPLRHPTLGACLGRHRWDLESDQLAT